MALQRGSLRARLTALLKANQAITSSLDLQQILQAVVRQASVISGTDVVRLFLLDEATQMLHCRIGEGIPVEELRDLVIPLGESFSGEVAATGKPLAVPDCRGNPRLRAHKHAEEYGLISYLGLPVKVGDRMLGVLVFNTTAPRVYSEDEISYLSVFADQAAIAIENARLHDAAVRRAQHLATLNELTRTLATVLDPQAVGREILAAVQVLIPGAVARLWEYAGDTEVLQLVASIGLRDPEGGTTRTFRHGMGLIGTVVAERQPIVCEEVAQDPRFLNKAWAAVEGLISCVCLPLIQAERVCGALLIYTRVPHAFTDNEVSLLRSLSAHAAIAIERARLFAATGQRASELSALRDVGHAISSQLELFAVLKAVVTGATHLLGSQHAQILLWDEASQNLRYGAASGSEAERVRAQTLEPGRGVNGTVALTRQPMILDDYQGSPYALPEFPEIVATITIPVLFGDRLLGVLHSHSTQPGKRFRPDEFRLFQMLATQAAIAIENAQLHDAVRRHADELEDRVRERTAELEEALRVKAEFLGKMSHELRTPLNFILGFTDLLLQGAGGPLRSKQVHFLDRIQTGGKRLLELVTAILNLSRLEEGTGGLHLGPIPLAPLVQEILARVQITLRQKRLAVTTDLDPEIPLVVADRGMLAQIIAHLVGNAVKFTPEGGRITVTARQVKGAAGSEGIEDSRLQMGDLETSARSSRSAIANRQSAIGDFVEIAVTDTGIGISPEALEQIFVPFHQVDGSETRSYGGAGVGLTLARQLVELHGGRTWAESTGLGQGARFVVRLPRLTAPRAPRVLLVDDDPSVLDALGTTLESVGYVVERTESGSQALAALKAQPTDLLILDIALPDVDGWEVLRRVRGAEATQTLPVLVITGVDSVHGNQALAVGADEFLAKPISARVLVDTVSRMLGRAATGRVIQ